MRTQLLALRASTRAALSVGSGAEQRSCFHLKAVLLQRKMKSPEMPDMNVLLIEAICGICSGVGPSDC